MSGQDQIEVNQSDGTSMNNVNNSDERDLNYGMEKANQRIYSLSLLVFIVLSMIAGILIICLTSKTPTIDCKSTFERIMKSSLVSSSKPRSVAIGDLNNDNLSDIVVANYGANTIGIFISQGHGNFNEQKTYSTGINSLPYSVTIADFNNDTHLDIAVANYGLNNIQIFLGIGNGSFNDFIIISLAPSRPIFVTIGDFNNDNQVDIAVVNAGTNSFGILLGYGNVSFQNYQIYSTNYDSYPYSLVVGHFNNDSYLDIAVANSGTDNIGIFLGVGDGSFEDQFIYSTTVGSNPSLISKGDFNNDNHSDIIVSNNGTGNIGIFFGYGNGTFQQQQTYLISSNSYPQYVNVADFNGDNHLDIIVVDSINDQIHIIQGIGNGSFSIISTYDGISESYPFCIGLSDFNNNNQTDIVVANNGINNILVLMDYVAKPSVRKTIIFSGYAGVGTVAVGDFNNDNIPDIVGGSLGWIHIFLGLENGSFVENGQYSPSSISVQQYISVGDVNNDNQTDILIADTAMNSIDVLLGKGNGNFSEAKMYSTGNFSQPYWLALGDFNHDNAPDIVSAHVKSKSVGIHIGYGNGSFAPMITYYTANGYSVYSVAVHYIDSDNHLDFAVCDSGNMITIFIGFGNGSFYIKTTLHATGTGPLPSIALANFNNDNLIDIVVVDYEKHTMRPYDCIINDFNNDHINDIAVNTIDTNEILIFYGFGNGSFELGRNYSIGGGSSPTFLVAADWGNNKQLEIVVGLVGTKQIIVLTEYYAAEFKMVRTFSTGSAPQPHSVYIDQFDNNNKSLIVTTNSGNDSLNILFIANNNHTQVTYSLEKNSQPEYAITCDINNDKQLDVISVNSKSNSISIILGNNNETFGNETIYSTGDSSKPYGIVSSDLNNDTRLDLIIANTGTDQIGILYRFNFTTFQPYARYLNNRSFGPYGIVVSDFNTDNYMDIAVAFRDNDYMGVFLGYGNGSFMTMTTYSTGNKSFPNYLDVGDFNNDNKTDIAVANLDSNDIAIFLGYGNGSFAEMIAYSTGEGGNPQDIAIDDLNNDSRLDIVVANSGSNTVGILFGHGNGSFSNIELYSTGEGSYPISVAIGDMNNDSRLDIIVANRDGRSVGIFFAFDNGTFQDQVILQTNNRSRSYWLIVDDFNKDNQLDIVVSIAGVNSLTIIFGPINESFSNNFTYFIGFGSFPTFICTGDFNHDTYLDIAAVNNIASSIVILFGLGDGTFLQGRPISVGINGYPVAMSVADFNNDSQLDFVISNYAPGELVVFLGDNSEYFGSIRTISTGTGSQPHSVEVGDCNNDGQMDIIVANYGTNNVGVFLGYPNRIFGSMMTYSTGNNSSPYCVALTDLNNDQNLDIVVTNSQSNNIMIMFGIGNGSFIDKKIYSTGDQSHPYQFVIYDMNNDHLLDLIIANSGTSNILLFYGLENGTFGNQESYSLGYRYEPYSIDVSDLNGDGKMDIVVACYGTDHVEILLRIC